MKLLSINVARPRLVRFRNETVSTAIFKKPVEGPVEATELGLVGDDQADKSVHGGVDKAVYAYAEENYQWWREHLPDRELPPGELGENLTVRGMVDDEVQIGDRFRIGTAVFEITQPRQPCFKLGIKMQMPTIVKMFHQAGRPGFYLRVLEPGVFTAGDDIECVSRAENSITIAELYRLRFDPKATRDQLEHAEALSGLSEAWRDEFRAALERR
ncbi:MOSC domain-containing protein [Aeoliella sp. SH292]|uniref:MOSC domain-containing protein n=1 Tax=Aeoliella sp. SH292 TaxID=3454464 RepID=UPI003F950F81